MKLLRIDEFRKISGFTEKALIWLLANGKLPCSIGKSGELLINCQDLEVKSLIAAVASRTRQMLEEHQPLIDEKIDALMAEQMEEMVDLIIERLRS